MTKELVKKLHPHEEKILLALKKLEKANPSEIAKETKIHESSIHKASLWARLKGLVKQEEKITFSSKLTQEGKTYLKKGPPEKNLLKKIGKGKPISKLKKEFPKLDIALAWAKKEKWIKIDKDTVKLTPLGRSALKRETKTEKTLKTISKGEQADIGAITKLKKRKLIKVREIKDKTLSLTPHGRNVVNNISKKPDQAGMLTPEHIKSGSWRKLKFRSYDVNTPAPTINPYKIHPYIQFINNIRKKLITLGFEETTGPWVETSFWNFDALFMPQDHPARGIHDIFELKTPVKGKILDKRALKRVAETHKSGWITGSRGWGYWNPEEALKLVLRSQTTSVSARSLARFKPREGKFFTIDRNFRPDVPDSIHSLEFYQCDCITIGENLTLRHLFGYLEAFAKEIAGAEDVRFRPGFFPFTEPSIEVDVMINGRWIEVAGSGIFRPEVTQPLGVDKTVLAWAFGLDRLAMIKLNVSDIRALFTSDLDWLRKKPIVLE